MRSSGDGWYFRDREGDRMVLRYFEVARELCKAAAYKGRKAGNLDSSAYHFRVSCVSYSEELYDRP
jgi:hypothetical protein